MIMLLDIGSLLIRIIGTVFHFDIYLLRELQFPIYLPYLVV